MPEHAERFTNAPSPDLRPQRQSESRYAWNQVGVAFFTGGMFNGTIIYAYSLL